MVTWLPGVERQYFGPNGGTWSGGPGRIVLHTTETVGWPGYNDGNSAPHFTVRWNGSKLLTRQHIPLDVAARALRNEPGGVQTNREMAWQVEIIGTCDSDANGDVRRAGAFYWPDAGDDALKALGEFIVTLAEAVNVPLLLHGPFVQHPRSYGTRASQRMSGARWDDFRGVCGHQHVPENSHGDPGDTRIGRAIALALAADRDEDDKPSRDEDRDKPAKPKPKPLVVDGYLGRKTIRRWQRIMGTPIDGVISEPSMLVRAVQHKIGLRGRDVSGRLDARTVRRLQRYLGTPVDGVISRPSLMVKALQRRLNDEKF